MAYEIQKHCIITGIFDSYCLLCEVSLTTGQCVDQHIKRKTHISNLNSNTYLPNYKHDGIRQVKGKYYCEFCNVLYEIKLKVAQHLEEEAHKYNRGIHSLVQVEHGVLAFDAVFLDFKAWHGFVNNTCVICNVDITDESAHTHEISHILNLIQIKLKFKENNIFRKVDNELFNCITCNCVLNMETFATHFHSESHGKGYKKCKELYDCYINSQNQTINDISNVHDFKNTSTNAGPEPEIAGEELSKKERTIKTFEKQNNATTAAENLNETINPDKKKIIDDAPCVDDETSKCTGGTSNNCDSAQLYQPHAAIQIAKLLAKENGIKFKYGSHSAYCHICDIRISSSLKRMKEHVATRTHKENLPEKCLNPIAKTPLSEYIEQIIEMRNPHRSIVILNRKICIDYLSFHMIVTNGHVSYCQLCEKNLYAGLIELHLNTKPHTQNIWNRVKVIINTKYMGEFLREIRRNVYHCGFCNTLSNGLVEMDNHIESSLHERLKCFSFANLFDILAKMGRKVFN